MAGRTGNIGPVVCWEARMSNEMRMNRRELTATESADWLWQPLRWDRRVPWPRRPRSNRPNAAKCRPRAECDPDRPVSILNPLSPPASNPSRSISGRLGRGRGRNTRDRRWRHAGSDGPWVVSWYKETGRLGVEDENVVVAAHVDYWNVGPAVFYNIRNLKEGDIVDLTGEDNNLYRYTSSG